DASTVARPGEASLVAAPTSTPSNTVHSPVSLRSGAAAVASGLPVLVSRRMPLPVLASSSTKTAGLMASHSWNGVVPELRLLSAWVTTAVLAAVEGGLRAVDHHEPGGRGHPDVARLDRHRDVPALLAVAGADGGDLGVPLGDHGVVEVPAVGGDRADAGQPHLVADLGELV